MKCSPVGMGREEDDETDQPRDGRDANEKARMLRYGHPRSTESQKTRDGTAIFLCVETIGQEPFMTYKLNPQLKLIKAPVILLIDGQESSYGSGEELTPLSFEKNYIIDSISARDGSVIVKLNENDGQFNMNWVGEEAVSFM